MHIAKDEYPQWWLLATAKESTDGTYLETAAERSPIVIHSDRVMEILGYQWEFSGVLNPDANVDASGSIRGQVTSKSKTAMSLIDDADVVVKESIFLHREFAEGTPTGGAGWAAKATGYVSWSDNGKGPLYAMPEVFVAVQGDTEWQTTNFSVKILYRLVKVTKDELLGLLASFLSS